MSSPDGAAALHADVEAGEAAPRGYDFRRPDKFGREQVRRLSVVHEVFARRFASSLGSALRALVSLEPLAVDQLSFDDYVRSMPNPTAVSIIGVAPLPGAVTMELDIPLALLLVDRLLGGRPGAGFGGELRRPTELETFLIRDLVQHGVAGLREALSQIGDLRPELGALEYNPQFVQVAPPSDTVLLLSYRMTVSQGLSSEGLVTLCYPSSVLGPLLERLGGHGPGTDQALPAADEQARAVVEEQLRAVDVSLAVRLRDCQVPASDLAALRVGDVLRMDHRAGEPALVTLGGIEIFTGHLGRRGRRLAIQVERWRPTTPDHP